MDQMVDKEGRKIQVPKPENPYSREFGEVAAACGRKFVDRLMERDRTLTPGQINGILNEIAYNFGGQSNLVADRGAVPTPFDPSQCTVMDFAMEAVINGQAYLGEKTGQQFSPGAQQSIMHRLDVKYNPPKT
jgi:hypothetical protein